MTKYTVSTRSNNDKKRKNTAIGGVAHDDKQASGWSKAGKEKYNELYKIVYLDRLKYGKQFNKELFEVYKKEYGDGANGKNRKQANDEEMVICYDDLNPPSFQEAGLLDNVNATAV